MPARVLHVVRPAAGGMARHVVGLLTHLDRRLFIPILAAAPGHGLLEEARRAGIETLPVPLVDGFSLSLDRQTVSRLAAYLDEYSIEIVHAHGLKASLLAGMAAGCSGSRLVSTVHGFPDLRPGFKGYLGTLMQWQAVRYVDHFIAVSPAAGQVLASRYRVPAEKISLIPNGIEMPAASIPTPSERGVATGRPVVGTVARLVPEKGLADFLQAAAYLQHDFPQATFLIVGSGPLRQRLQEQAKRLGLQSQAVFAGHQTNVFSWLDIFDVFVASSVNEGFSVATLEAMTAGKAIVATRVGGLAQLVQDGHTGLLVPPHEPVRLAAAVRKLLSDPELAVSLGNNARRVAGEQYSLTSMTRQTEKLYISLLGEADDACPPPDGTGWPGI